MEGETLTVGFLSYKPDISEFLKEMFSKRYVTTQS